MRHRRSICQSCASPSNGGSSQRVGRSGAIAEHVVGLHQLVDLARAFVDHRALAVAVEAADRVFVGVAVGAVDLHRVAGRALRGDRGEPLRQPGLPGVAAALVLQEAGAQPEQPRRLIVGLHLRDHLLHELMLGDRRRRRSCAPSRSCAGVAAGANQAGGAGGDGVAPLIEREHRNLESFARPPDEVLLGHLDVVHLEEAGVAGEDAPLLLQRPAREALERALDDEGAEAGGVALLLLLEIGPGEDEEVVGDVGERDPHLLAGQDVAIAALDRDRLDAAHVAAGAPARSAHRSRSSCPAPAAPGSAASDPRCPTSAASGSSARRAPT